MMTKESSRDLIQHKPIKGGPQVMQLWPQRYLRYLQLCRTYAVILVLALLPSYVAEWLRQQPKPSARAFPTAYLDGLRGLFSFLVFVRHFLLPWEKDLDTGYGQNGNTNFLKLPIIRTFYSGPTVAIFFIVSGYVISNKPLKFIRKKEFSGMSKAMISSVFRRGMRLFLPPIISTFLVAIAVYLGCYNTAYDRMPGEIPGHPQRFNSLIDQLGDWLRFVQVDLTHPWSWKSPRSEYDSHLWTIPIQFRASMIVFLTLLGLAKTKPKIRSCCLFILLVYSLQQKKWQVALFFAGVVLAERNLLQIESNAQVTPTATDLPLYEKKKPASLTWIIVWRVLFIIGLYLGSYPRAQYAGPATPGFVWLSKITEDDRYWQSYGATLLVWSVSNDHMLQRQLSGPVLRYLGNISFSLYLVHGPVLHLFGYSLVPYFWELTGSDTVLRQNFCVGLALLLLTPIILWIADIFWRLVDKPCGVLVVQVENKCFV